MLLSLVTRVALERLTMKIPTSGGHCALDGGTDALGYIDLWLYRTCYASSQPLVAYTSMLTDDSVQPLVPITV